MNNYEFIIELAKLVVALLSPVLIYWLSRKLDGIHKQINSRMDEMLVMKKQEGKQEEKNEQKSKQKKG